MDATFLMSNMVPQVPALNRGPWEKLEEYTRGQARDGEQDFYLVAGPAEQPAVGPDGTRRWLRRPGGRIAVPGKCWKVVLGVPVGTSDPKRVTAADSRVWAVVMPNVEGLDSDWRSHAVPVREVEKLTGYTFFTNLPAAVAEDLRSRKPETRARAERPPPNKVATKKGAEAKGLELPAFREGCIVANRRSKVYHLPGGRYYEKGKDSKDAVFFKSAKDAEAAGYRASKR
jgi:hypothetical protein